MAKKKMSRSKVARVNSYIDQLMKSQLKASLQMSISSDIKSKFSDFKEMERELKEISEEYKTWVEEERFLESEAWKFKMDELEKFYFDKQMAFIRMHENLELIVTAGIYLN